MRLKFVRTLLVLALLGNIIVWYRIWRLFATQNALRLLTPSVVTPDPPQKLHRRLARLVTVVIRQFETFENDVTSTVESVLNFFPTIPILIVSNELLYPPLELDFANESMRNVKLINMEPEFNKSYDERNPLFYIRTKYVLFLPDGSRLSTKQVMQETISHVAKLGVVSVPVGSISLNCIGMDLKVKEWSLKFSHMTGNECDGINGKHATMIETKLLRKLTDPFLLPFTDALYIQTTALDSGIDSDPKTTSHIEDERLFLVIMWFAILCISKVTMKGSDSSCSSTQTQTSQHNSTTKQLQRKLEARIEQAKRIQRNSDYVKLPKYDKGCGGGSSAAGLIPIQRLPIPNKNKEHLPLVEYWHSDSESEGEMTLFPMSNSKDSSKHKQDLTDTFSIEEMSEESEDSLNLGPAQPSPELKFMKSYGCTGDCFRCQCHIL